jgi:hypothetical protein
MVMGLQSVTSVVFLVVNNFGKMWVSWRNIRGVFATPSGIKREWYVCMYYSVVLVTSKELTASKAATKTLMHITSLGFHYNTPCLQCTNSRHVSSNYQVFPIMSLWEIFKVENKLEKLDSLIEAGPVVCGPDYETRDPGFESR